MVRKNQIYIAQNASSRQAWSAPESNRRRGCDCDIQGLGWVHMAPQRITALLRGAFGPAAHHTIINNIDGGDCAPSLRWAVGSTPMTGQPIWGEEHVPTHRTFALRLGVSERDVPRAGWWYASQGRDAWIATAPIHLKERPRSLATNDFRSHGHLQLTNLYIVRAGVVRPLSKLSQGWSSPWSSQGWSSLINNQDFENLVSHFFYAQIEHSYKHKA